MSQLPPQQQGGPHYQQPGMYPNPAFNNDKDASNIKNLSIGFIVWGCIVCFFSLFFIIYIVLGVTIQEEDFGLNRSYGSGYGGGYNAGPSEAMIGSIFMIVGIVGLLVGELIGILSIVSGVSLKKHKNKTLIMITAGINCFSFPLGTTLGVITFVVLSKPGAKALFER